MKNYRDGDRLNLQDFNFVFDLLQRHPSSERKLGASGVAHFTIRHAPPWFRNRAFYIVRNDGLETEFSFKECLSPQSHAVRFQNACRTAVADQIIAFVEASFSDVECVACAITGATVTRASYHVDHEPPFRDLSRPKIYRNGEYRRQQCTNWGRGR